MRRLEDLEELNNYDMHQVTIDLIQDAQEVIDEPRSPEHIGAFAYKISTFLEVLNPVFVHDIKAMDLLFNVLNEEQEKLNNSVVK
jgi:hypothetical protein